MNTSRLSGLLLAASALVLLTGCTGSVTPPGHSIGPLEPDPPQGEVIGQGLVMQTADEVKLCLGPIAESWPPQCQGMPLDGWSWEGVEGSESSGDVRWGMYAVTGTYDGSVFTLTGEPILLALYDPMAPEDPTGGTPGTTSEARLIEIQEQLPDILAPGTQYFSSTPDRGYLWAQVIWDDGTIQTALDAHYGAGVVIIESALREIG